MAKYEDEEQANILTRTSARPSFFTYLILFFIFYIFSSLGFMTWAGIFEKKAITLHAKGIYSSEIEQKPGEVTDFPSITI